MTYTYDVFFKIFVREMAFRLIRKVSNEKDCPKS